ncbi:Twinfilin-1 [Apophysomyces sp. BC1021]|nr:Twinfilin-1 [Apophysomyces sp. BC1021]
MSHQSGIQVSKELAETFNNAVANGNTRILRISIVNESLVANGSTDVEKTFEQDYEEQVPPYLESSQPAYVLVRLDNKSSTGEYQWIFLSYVPDNAKVREKMLYASTRATLTKELGDYRFVDSLYGTQASELTYDGYKKHLAHKKADAPLTRRERELAEIKLAEAKAVSDYQGTTTRKAYAPGVSFPVTEEAEEALRKLTQPKDQRQHNFVSLHLKDEKIELDAASSVSAGELKNTIPTSAPRFTFYLFEHETTESMVFIYTCPSSSKIRERMLYSSSKANVVTYAETEIKLQVTKKLETSDISDITEAYLLEELEGSKASNDQAQTDNGVGLIAERIQMLGGTTRGGFRRPVAPGRRRPAAH